MKQRIEVEQLLELNKEQRRKLREWWKPEQYDAVLINGEELPVWDCTIDDEIIELYKAGEGLVETIKEKCLPLLSIGQMIELLQYKGLGWIKPVIDCDTIITVEGWNVST